MLQKDSDGFVPSILKNWEAVFGEENGNNKYNKNLILYELREMTSLTTKEIRSSMKKFKQMYYVLSQQIRENGQTKENEY